MSIQNITGGSVNSYTLDALTITKDSTSVTTTAVDQVGGAARILDFGGVASGTLVEQVAYTRGHLVVDVTAFDFTTGDEFVHILWLISDNASAAGTGFTAGDVVRVKGAISLGAVASAAVFNAVGNVDNNTALNALGRYSVGVSNEYNGALFRFGCTAHVVGGTTPIITYNAAYMQELPV